MIMFARCRKSVQLQRLLLESPPTHYLLPKHWTKRPLLKRLPQHKTSLWSPR